jgi:1,4-dihydroxy-2-naphthoate octaprenyltransferase
MFAQGALRANATARALTVVRAIRPPFLLMSVVCVLLAVVVAWREGAVLASLDIVLVFVGALAAHASVNLFNEYEDARSGLDAHTVRTPFSGGSGALLDDPAGLNAVRRAAQATLILTLLIGAWCVARHGLLLLPLGALGIALIVAYTPWINRYPLLCLIAPGLGVGPLMVLGTVAVLCERLSLQALAAALVPGLLGSNLLLANQFPDIEADRAVGRRHAAIAYGRDSARRIYGALALLTALLLLGAVATALFPPLALIALVPLMAMLPTLFGLARHGTGARLAPYLACNVAAALLTPLLLAYALWRG